MSVNSRPLCLLALDGGGVRGLSELYILNEIMLRIQKQQGLAVPPKPCEIFDLVCGTSTGGLIALMLARLRMSVDQVIEQYCVVAETVFGKPKGHFSEGRFRATSLEKAIQDTVKKYGEPKDESGECDSDLKLLDEESSAVCDVFVCSRSAKAMNTVRLFRSYRSFTSDQYVDMTIWQAARATSAAPTIFKRLKMGRSNAQEEFLDGGLGTNNPTKILIKEAIKRYDANSQEIACIISIGTGRTKIMEYQHPDWFQKAIPFDLIKALRNMATDCEDTARELDEDFSKRPGVYYRFNVDQGLENVPLAEWRGLGNITEKTLAYLANHRVSAAVDEAAAALSSRKSKMVLSDLDHGLSADTRLTTKHFVPFERKIPYFIGRATVLNEIRAVFDNNLSKSVTIVLRAMGGQGKTQVALEYCHRSRESRYQYVLWLDAENHALFEQSCVTIANDLLAVDTTEDMMSRIATENLSVPQVMSCKLRGKKYLMVIDNLDKLSEYDDIRKYLSLEGVAHVIITSRHMDADELGLRIDLSALSVDEGNSLLTQKAGRALTDSDLQDRMQIVHELGGLPLALHQAALLIREKNLTYAQFLSEFQTARAILLDKDLPEFWEYKKLMADGSEMPDLRRRVGVQTTWTISFEYLQNQTQGHAKCQLLTLSAYLSSTSISQTVFQPYLQSVRSALHEYKSDPEHRSAEVVLGPKRAQRIARAFKWALPFINDVGPVSASDTFSDFIRDALKIGLVTATQFHEMRGTNYSMHPMISRWLVDRDKNASVDDAIGVVFQCLSITYPQTTNLAHTSETVRHMHACIGHIARLPDTAFLDAEYILYAGRLMCFSLLGNGVQPNHKITRVLKKAHVYMEERFDNSPVREKEIISYLPLYGKALLAIRRYDEAKSILQSALTQISIASLESFEFTDKLLTVLGLLTELYVATSDDDSLLAIYDMVPRSGLGLGADRAWDLVKIRRVVGRGFRRADSTDSRGRRDHLPTVRSCSVGATRRC